MEWLLQKAIESGGQVNMIDQFNALQSDVATLAKLHIILAVVVFGVAVSYGISIFLQAKKLDKLEKLIKSQSKNAA